MASFRQDTFLDVARCAQRNGSPQQKPKEAAHQNDPDRHQKAALAGRETPTELDNITVTDSMSAMLPWTVNGCVYRKLLPNWTEEALAYHVVKMLSLSTDNWFVCRLPPDAAIKMKVACVTCRGVE